MLPRAEILWSVQPYPAANVVHGVSSEEEYTGRRVEISKMVYDRSGSCVKPQSGQCVGSDINESLLDISEEYK